MLIDYTAVLERFRGFAHSYDRFRPAPPDDFGPLLTQLIQIERPELVVDLGCGTGLSTRYWAERAAQVVGVEPSPGMIAEARAGTPQPNVSYLEGYGHQVSLPGQCADIITCCDSLHWMEPEATFSEIARLLRPGGAFAWVHYSDDPVITPCLLDQAHGSFMRQSEGLDEARGITAPILRWTRGEYISQMQARFRHWHEFHLHQVLRADADQYLGWISTQGHVQSLLKLGVSAEEMGLAAIETQARQILGDGMSTWYWSAEVRVAVL